MQAVQRTNPRRSLVSSQTQFLEDTLKMASFFFLTFLHFFVMSVGVPCIVKFKPQSTCYYYDFSADNCFPWNVSKCPEPYVAYRVKKCPFYECDKQVSFRLFFEKYVLTFSFTEQRRSSVKNDSWHGCPSIDRNDRS